MGTQQNEKEILKNPPRAFVFGNRQSRNESKVSLSGKVPAWNVHVFNTAVLRKADVLSANVFTLN